MARKVLIVEDDSNIAELLHLYLEKEGFETAVAGDGGKGVELFRSFHPELVLLDIMLPVMDGWSVLKKIRENDKTPVIMLTAKGETQDKVAGLEGGADDYIVKPFEMKEVLARIHAVLRRFGGEEEGSGEKKLSFDKLVINLDSYELLVDGKRVDTVEYRSTVEEQLLGYQNMAMRTLGFAFKIVDDNAPNDCVELVAANDLNFLGVVAISDPIRPDVSAAVEKCQSAGIGIKIVTGDTPGTATEIARQIGLWNSEDTERNRITGTAFAELTDEEALDRVMDLKIMSRARPTDKQRLVQLLQQKGAVVAVTGDGTNDAPALNHAQVGLSMGTGTSVAKEASDITLLDDSFNSIGTAVMWGRSLYKNIQRFIVFQLTINFVALLIVLLGSFMGTALPLTVTQMLWVNLIMDTFAALALASIPPSETVMNEKPRRSTDFIISKTMQYNIFGVGTVFLIVLLGMIYYYTNAEGGMTVHRLTIFFTFLVMLQFWNLFNARVFRTNDSAFKGLSKSYGMELIVIAILGGQILIVQFGGAVFRTEPLDWQTWLIIIGTSSLVLWVGELIRFVQRLIHK